MTRLDTVRQMTALGYTNPQIAAELGLKSDRQVIRLKHQAGVTVKSYEIPSDEQKAEIRRLSEEEQWPPEEIAETLGVSMWAIRQNVVKGPGDEWSATSSELSRKYPRLWRELMRAS